MQNLEIFKNEQFGDIRALKINGEPWFCLADVCKILQLNNPRQVKIRLSQDGVITNDGVVKNGLKSDGTEYSQLGNLNFINEPNLYRCIFQSRKPEADKFQKWVFEEVIPQIRKMGIYATDNIMDKILEDPDYFIKLMSEYKNERAKRKQAEIESAKNSQIIHELRPKATYYDLILQNKSLVAISKIAKDYGMSGKSFNNLLHEVGVQYKMGDCWLIYQEYADKGYTQSRTHIIDAEKSVMHTYWTPKGRLFIYDILKNERNILPIIERMESEEIC